MSVLLSSFTLLFCFFFFDTTAGSPEPPAIVFPLVFTPANVTRGYFSAARRHLRSTARARMPLYDDLLTNGYYTTRLFIGTPPQEFALIVDSGSTGTYVPCSTCNQCGKHQDPRFQPDLSSSYKPVKCNMDCTCDSDNNQCTYDRQYAEMSSSNGVLGEDVVSFGNQSALEPQRAAFGCENSETGDLFSQHADGIMGLGRGQLSIMDQLVEKRVISDSFSLCYGGMDVGGGAMILGGISPPAGMVFSHSDPSRSILCRLSRAIAYSDLLPGAFDYSWKIHVSGKLLKINPKVFDSKHGAVLDSGTTYAYLPEDAFTLLQDSIMRKLHSLKQVRGPDPNYKDICFTGSGSEVSDLPKTFPEVDMVFGNGQKLTLSPENYLFWHSKVNGAYCLGIFQNGKDPTTLLRGIIVRNTLVTYDRQNETIGFWKTNCSELWERLHIEGGFPPAPLGSVKENSTEAFPPALPSTQLQDNAVQGEFQVGLITFDMYLGTNCSDLDPHVKELTQLIAQELQVNTSQVQLLSSKPEGNGTQIRLAILPESPASFISNRTAMGIIARLNKHHLQLPKNFRSYQLLEWKVNLHQEEMKFGDHVRSWWKRHYWAVIFGISAAAFITFSTLGIWYFWVHRPKVGGTYRPVDTAVPDKSFSICK